MMTCKGTGKAVSNKVQRQSIFTGGTWLGWCHHCESAAPWALAEVRKDNRGYMRRYSAH